MCDTMKIRKFIGKLHSNYKYESSSDIQTWNSVLETNNNFPLFFYINAVELSGLHSTFSSKSQIPELGLKSNPCLQ